MRWVFRHGADISTSFFLVRWAGVDEDCEQQKCRCGNHYTAGITREAGAGGVLAALVRKTLSARFAGSPPLYRVELDNTAGVNQVKQLHGYLSSALFARLAVS
jgi:hypothetical protein